MTEAGRTYNLTKGNILQHADTFVHCLQAEILCFSLDNFRYSVTSTRSQIGVATILCSQYMPNPKVPHYDYIMIDLQNN